MAPKAAGKFSLTTKVGPGSFRQPVWVWAAVGVGAWYVYTRATQTAAPAGPEPADTGTTYADTAGYDSYGTYDSGGSYGGGAGGGGDLPPEVAPPAEVTPPAETQDAGTGGGTGHGDRRKQRRRAITAKIHKLQRGGVTAAERPRIQRLRQRRQHLRG